jgi:hypothetical protein
LYYSARVVRVKNLAQRRYATCDDLIFRPPDCACKAVSSEAGKGTASGVPPGVSSWAASAAESSFFRPRKRLNSEVPSIFSQPQRLKSRVTLAQIGTSELVPFTISSIDTSELGGRRKDARQILPD